MRSSYGTLAACVALRPTTARFGGFWHVRGHRRRGRGARGGCSMCHGAAQQPPAHLWTIRDHSYGPLGAGTAALVPGAQGLRAPRVAVCGAGAGGCWGAGSAQGRLGVHLYVTTPSNGAGGEVPAPPSPREQPKSANCLSGPPYSMGAPPSGGFRDACWSATGSALMSALVHSHWAYWPVARRGHVDSGMHAGMRPRRAGRRRRRHRCEL